jgi:receptor protein-tyrosine kinase
VSEQDSNKPEPDNKPDAGKQPDRSQSLAERAAAKFAAMGDPLNNSLQLPTPGAAPQAPNLAPLASNTEFAAPKQDTPSPVPLQAVTPALPATPPTAAGFAPLPSPAIVSHDEAPPDVVNIGTLLAAGMVVSGTARTRISEEYRIAVSRILRNSVRRNVGTRGELIMVTSARPGEGKSFTSLNLAGAIAHNVMRPTVLVDVDFKKRSLTHLLRLSDRKGLLDVASTGRVSADSLIIPTAIDHLSILPVGRDAGDLEGGLQRRPVAEVIEYLASRFPDVLFILDLPPCLSTSDPSTLAPVVNEAIVVVEAERTQRAEVESALDLIKLCPKITVLLNKIRTTRRNTFGAYDYYGSYS